MEMRDIGVMTWAWFSALPPVRQQAIRGALASLIEELPTVRAIAVVGSCAENTYDRGADIDIAMCHRGRPADSDVYSGIRRRCPHIAFNFFNHTEEGLRRHFALGSEAAWAIRRSKILYDPYRVLEQYTTCDPPLPHLDWVEARLERIRECDERGGGIQGKFLGLVQILLALRAHSMLTTKAKLRKAFMRVCRNRVLRKTMEVATNRKSPWGYSSRERSSLREAVRVLEEMVARDISAIRGIRECDHEQGALGMSD